MRVSFQKFITFEIVLPYLSSIKPEFQIKMALNIIMELNHIITQKWHYYKHNVALKYTTKYTKMVLHKIFKDTTINNTRNRKA